MFQVVEEERSLIGKDAGHRRGQCIMSNSSDFEISRRGAVGGIAPKPWRVEAAEAALPNGSVPVAARLLEGARPTPENEFKLALVQRTLGAVIAEGRPA